MIEIIDCPEKNEGRPCAIVTEGEFLVRIGPRRYCGECGKVVKIASNGADAITVTMKEQNWVDAVLANWEFLKMKLNLVYNNKHNE